MAICAFGNVFFAANRLWTWSEAMAISFEFKDGLFWIRFSGLVSNNDLMAILAAFEAVEDQQAVTPHRITDLSDVTEMQIGFDDVLTLASQRRVKRFPNSFKSAIVAVNETQT